MNLLARLRGRSTANPFAWLPADELSRLLDSPSPPLMIDVRAPAEFTGR